MRLQEEIGHRELALKGLACSAKGRVLDVASGSGYLARHLLNRNARIFCIDIDPVALRRTKNELAPSRAPSFVCCDARRLPFRSGSFDSVLTWSALVHIPEWRMVVNEMFRVSRGIVATCEPKGAYSVRAWRDYRCCHAPPTPEELTRAFAGYGSVERVEKDFLDEIRCVKQP